MVLGQLPRQPAHAGHGPAVPEVGHHHLPVLDHDAGR